MSPRAGKAGGRSGKGNGKEPIGFEQKLWAAADKMRGHGHRAAGLHLRGHPG